MYCAKIIYVVVFGMSPSLYKAIFFGWSTLAQS